MRPVSFLRVALFAAILHAPLVGAEAQAGAAPTGGWFHVIWRDAEQPTPMRSEYHVLIDDAGTWWDLDLDPALVRQPGSALAFDRQRVTIDAVRLAPRALGERTPRLLVRSVRQEEIGPGLRPMIAADAPAVLGSRPYITILCRFADAPTVTPATKERMEQVMGSAYPGMDHYYREMSGDLANLAGSVVAGWYALPQPRSFYITSTGANLNLLSQDCTAAADADVHFPSFSGINLQFNQRLDCCSWGGSRTLTRDGVTKSYPMTWMADWAIGHSVYGHEIGHSFGWPHSHGMYGAEYDSKWDVMSSSYNYRDPSLGWMAVQTIAFHKDRAGWIPSSRKFIAPPSGSTQILLERGALPASGASYLIAQVPIPASSSYYTIEARRFSGSYDTRLPGEAVIIHKTNGYSASVVDIDNNGNPNDAAAQWHPGETFTDSAAKIRVTVDALEGSAYRVTIQTGIDLLTLAASPGSRRDSAVVGATTMLDDSAAVALTGNGAATTDWTAAKRKAWTTLTAASGTGSGTVRWRRDPAGLAIGTYVDTITITAAGAAGSPARVIDTLRITAPPGGLTLVASPVARRDSVVVGTTDVKPDSATVTLSGSGASAAAWSATSSRPWTTLVTAAGTGSGRVRWTRDPTGLSIGTYVDTIVVTASGAAGSPAMIVDTLKILPAPPPLVMVLLTSSRRDSIMARTTRLMRDSVSLSFTGSGSASASWTAANRSSWLALSTPAGVGGGWVRWTRDPVGLTPGVYVDTITIASGTAIGSPSLVIDTLRVLALPSVDAAAEELLGMPRLTAFEKLHLDQEGNADGVYNLGDFLAFLDRSGLNVGGDLRARVLTLPSSARQERRR